jgi:hypothetical protein
MRWTDVGRGLDDSPFRTTRPALQLGVNSGDYVHGLINQLLGTRESNNALEATPKHTLAVERHL